MDTRTPEVIVIGGAIVDVLLQPVDAGVFAHSSTAVEGIRLSTGGDALNEATVLARLGHPPLLATKLGGDAAAGLILDHCSREGVAVHAVRQPGLDTGVNAVLVAPSGERNFITNRNGSLRRLAIGDVLPALEGPAFASAQIVCLASMFVSPMLDIPEMAE
ncbi:MAG TPA: sugar kinase, partial [Candidatus Faecivicinus avistercoris]|nr:sugar kinase [Candidatus Faecivicinus avistercoris]